MNDHRVRNAVLLVVVSAGLIANGCSQQIQVEASEFVPSDREVAISCQQEGGVVNGYTREDNGQTVYVYGSCEPP